nr:MAG TPA: Adhesin biosynthesis transcription regulatory protein [Caudoviricetes sp.]
MRHGNAAKKLTATNTAIAHGVSESTLYRARKRLYEAW